MSLVLLAVISDRISGYNRGQLLSTEKWREKLCLDKGTKEQVMIILNNGQKISYKFSSEVPGQNPRMNKMPYNFQFYSQSRMTTYRNSRHL